MQGGLGILAPGKEAERSVGSPFNHNDSNIQMKKTIAIVAGVVVVVAGGWLGATWYTGKRIEDVNAEELAKANAFLAAQYPRLGAKLENVTYERGFFVTNARYALTSTLADEIMAPDVHGAKPPPQVIWLDVRVEHGPFPKSAWREGHFAPKMAHTHAAFANNDVLAKVFELTGGQSPVTTNALVSYQGDALIDWSVPAVKYAKRGRSLAFSGATGTGHFSSGTQSGEGTMRVESLNVQLGPEEQHAHFAILGLAASGQSRMGKFEIGIGQGEVVADQIIAGSKDADINVTITKPAYRVTLSETEKTLGGEAAYSAENIQIGNVSIGSGQAVLKAANLDGDAVRALSKQYQKMSAALVMGSDDDNIESSMNSLTTMMGYGQQIMAGHPVFSVDPILLKTDKGEQRANLKIEFGPVPMNAATPQETAIKSVKRIDASMSLSKAMAVDIAAQFLADMEDMAPIDAQRMAEEQIDQGLMVAQMMNLGKIQDDKLVTTFTYADGVVNLNGTQTPVETFLAQFDDSGAEFESDEAFEAVPDDGSDEAEVDAAADAAVEDAERAADAAMSAEDVATVQVGNEVIDALTTDVVTPLLDNLGYSFEVDVDAAGDQHIKVNPGDTGAKEIEVVFFNCSDHNGSASCEDVLFRARFAAGRLATLEAVNAFNQENRWARAFLDEGKVPVVEMDLNADGGIGVSSMQTLVRIYFSLLEDFGDQIGAR